MAEDKITEQHTSDIQEERQRLAMVFAQALAAEQRIHDPAGKTSRRTSRTYSASSREDLDQWLTAPTSNEKNLRNASIYLYQINSRYRNLLTYYANVPCWFYTLTPANYNPAKTKLDAMKKQYVKSCQFIESTNIIRTMKEIMLCALREGAYYGVKWGGDSGAFILQKLDPDNCQIVSVSDGNIFRFVYDMSKIKEQDLDTYYPPQFADMYADYKKTGNQYQLVPSEIACCLKADPTVVEYSIPPFSSVLPALYAIKNIEDLDEAASELSNYKLLSGKIPTDDDGNPLIDYPTMMQYYGHIISNVGERVGVSVSPFEFKSFDFEQSGATSQMDKVARANNNFFASAGTSALLHGATNDTSGVTKLAIKSDEAFAFSLMYQCEAIINRFLKMFPGTVKFRINFLPVSIFNKEEMIDAYKSGMNFGMGKLQYAACVGIPQHIMQGQALVENEILDMDAMFKPMKTASTQSADDASEGGRPKAKDGEIGDAGENTRDTDANDNR